MDVFHGTSVVIFQRGHLPAGGKIGSDVVDRMKPQQAYCTGRLARLKREAFAQVFNVPIAAAQACVFVEPGVIEQLQTMVEPAAH